MLRRELDVKHPATAPHMLPSVVGYVWAALLAIVLAVGTVVAVVAIHCWHDDARAQLLHTRADPLMFGAATVGVHETPCIVRSETDHYDCMPRTLLIETSVSQWTLIGPSTSYNVGASSANALTTIGVLDNIDTDKMSFNPCAQTGTLTDQRFVAQVVDKAHHRTVYVPCEGMVYVVPDVDAPASK